MVNSLDTGKPVFVGIAAVLCASVSTYVGAALAKQLFPVLGAYGVAALRIGIAAILLMAFYRPWRRTFERKLLPATLMYGAALGLMNLLIYLAFARIPIGIAVAIEVTGPLAVVLFASRKPRDFLCFISAVTGLVLLLPLHTDNPLDPLGVAFAFGAATCWALYILAGKKISGAMTGDTVAWGMLVAAVCIIPFGAMPFDVASFIVVDSDSAFIFTHVIVIGLAIAFLSSVLPYLLEMEAMRRLPTHVFSILLSAAPAISALVGFAILDEVLSFTQWGAILLIFLASAGAALSTANKSG